MSLFERLELVDWGFKGAAHQRCMLRVERGAGETFLLVRVKPWVKTRQLRIIELQLTYTSAAVRQRIEHGDRGSWVPAEDLERDPIHQRT